MLLHSGTDRVSHSEERHPVPPCAHLQCDEQGDKNRVHTHIRLGGTLVYCIKILFSQALYWVIYSKLKNDQQVRSQDVSIATKYLFVIDMVNVFLLQTILILVPYNWMKKVIEIFKQLADLEETRENTQENSMSYIKFELNYIKLLKFYLIVRSIVLFIFAPFVFSHQAEEQKIILIVSMSLLLFEAFFVLVTLLVGIFAVRKNKRLAQLVQQSEMDRMVNQYIVLFICGAIRLAIDSIFFSVFIQKSNETKCSIDNVTPQFHYLRIANIIFQSTLTHFLPIVVILRIFNVELKQIDLSQSLLAAENYTEQNNNQ